jgi:hypothetical protein
MIIRIAVTNAAISRYFNVTPPILYDPKFPNDGNGSPMYLGLTPIQLSKVFLIIYQYLLST